MDAINQQSFFNVSDKAIGLFVSQMAAVAVLLSLYFGIAPSVNASPLKPSNSGNQANGLGQVHTEKTTATHVGCQQFSEPLFIKKMPVTCQPGGTCQKRLIHHVCQALKSNHCDTQQLWRPITRFIELPEAAKVTKITRATQSNNKVLLCWHYQKPTDQQAILHHDE
ncbi:hypothetical protein [Halioxenophilus aromaticivorans]|uniref:Uncharacterized protein n=1 Tax=Halioxenophilus aromaticivorans TaxID=1306992 RepID=A0AAV3TYP6_9ALTE